MFNSSIISYTSECIDYANNIIDFTGRCLDVEQMSLFCLTLNVNNCRDEISKYDMINSLDDINNRLDITDMLINSIKKVTKPRYNITESDLLFIVCLSKSLLLLNTKINDSMKITLTNDMLKEQYDLLNYWRDKVDILQL